MKDGEDPVRGAEKDGLLLEGAVLIEGRGTELLGAAEGALKLRSPVEKPEGERSIAGLE